MPRSTNVCDEYYDARMKAFWRRLEQVEVREETELRDDLPIVTPLGGDPFEPKVRTLKTLVR